MSAGWTPGPWDWWDDGEGLVRITEAAEQKFVAQATLPSNARLIAAAPKLYEALDDARMFVDLVMLRARREGDDEQADEAESALEDINAALAKARGESPHNQSNPKVGE